VLQVTGDIGTQWILDLCNGVVKEGCVPEDWRSSMVLPVCMGREDPMECGSCRGIRLLEHAVKVVEGDFKKGVRWRIDVDDVRFGFMKGGGTSDAIFVVRQMRERFEAREARLCFGFVDLERAFDRVPGEEIGWAMRDL